MARNRYDTDEILEDSFDVHQLKRLGSYIRPYTKKMIIMVIFMLITSALNLSIPYLFRYLIDSAIPNQDMNGILLVAAATFAITVFTGLFTRSKILSMSNVGQNIIHTIRKDIFTHLQKLPFSYYDDRPHGKIQVRVVNYVNSLSDLLSNGIVNTISDIFTLFLIIIFMLVADYRLTLISLAGLPILILIIIIIKKRQRTAWQIQSNKQSNLNAYIAESINGIRVTQSFVRENENEQIFNKLNTGYKTSWMKAVTYNFTLGPSVDFISVLTASFIYVMAIQWILAPEPSLTVGTLTLFTMLVGRFWAPINNLAAFYNSLLTAISYLERIFETIDEPVRVTDALDATEMPEIQGTVTFDNVHFSYEEGHPILNGISFTAQKGQSYAIVGPTGAGKTTIVNLISRFYNVDSGTIYVDGVDISKVTLNSLRSQMGIMMQDSFIFSGNIIDNIRYGKLDATDEEVIEAAKLVCAHDFISNMEDGYYTEVNERGSRLSAGQRQLISFARALLADPKILILDEATSSIDTETELLLQKGLARLLEGRTSFIIAHRLSTVKNSDCIMYVDKRGIVERGSHDELLKNKSEYYNLYLSQFDFLEEQN